MGITVWQGNTKGQFERLWERTEVTGGTCLCVCVCLFECAHIYMLGTRQTGMTPSGAHAWPSVSLLYITWHIVQKVVWRQCHPVQLNVSNVTYTGSSQTHTLLFLILLTFPPFLLYHSVMLLLTVSVPNDQCQPKVLTQGWGGRWDPINARGCALPPSASQPTFTCKPAKQHSNIPKVVLVCLYSVWDALWKSELICGGSCEIPSYWSWGPRVPAAAF